MIVQLKKVIKNYTMVPKKFFLTTGVGRDKNPIMSFAIALEDAKIGEFNLVKVSSIIPPDCTFVTKEKGLKFLTSGQIIYCVLAQNMTQKANELITAALGMAIPVVQTERGCVFEFTGIGKTKDTAGKEAEKLARELLSKAFGLQISQSLNIAQEVKGVDSIWTTVIATAVFI